MNDLGPSAAFDVMSEFLKHYWETGDGASDDIAVLLGSLSRHPDGLPVDPALWEDWLRAWEAVEGGAPMTSGNTASY